MRLLISFILLATASVFANPQYQYQGEESDAFHNSAFGSPDVPTPKREQQIQQQEEIPQAPLWDTPKEVELPERQEEESIPKNRVNEWQEQSKRASGEE